MKRLLYTTVYKTALLLIFLSAYAINIQGQQVFSGFNADFSFFIDADSTLYGFGSNLQGQLGDGNSNTWNTLPILVKLPAGVKVLAAAAGESHSLLLGNDGKIYSFGNNEYGQLGIGNSNNYNIPQPVNLPEGTKAIAITAGSRHNLVLGNDGKVYSFGDNNNGQLGTGDNIYYNTPQPVNLPQGINAIAIAAGFSHSLIAGSDGKIYSFGSNVYGALGTGNTISYNNPQAVSLPAEVKAVSVAVGYFHSLVLGNDGKLYSFGGNSSGQLGRGDTKNYNTPPTQGISPAPGVKALSVAAGSYYSLVKGDDGKLYVFGSNSSGQLGTGNTINYNSPQPVSLPGGVKIVSIAAGGAHSLVTGDDGILYSFGFNNLGQLGNGLSANKYTPTGVNVPSTLVQAAAGFMHSLVMGNDGKVYSFGSNGSGELGIENNTDTYLPTNVTLPAGVKAAFIAAGEYHNLIIGDDGKVYSFGYNSKGQLGNGNNTDYNSPQIVSLPQGVSAVNGAAGEYHSLIIGNDGKIYSFGDNSSGQLGTGNSTPYNNPQAISLPDGVKAIAVAAGENHSLVIGNDGKVYSFGENNYGQLGIGSTGGIKDLPQLVILPIGIKAIAVAAGRWHSIVIGDDGKIYSFGDNDLSQLGTGNNTSYSVPQAVSLPGGVKAIAAATNDIHNIVLGEDGKIYTFGSNDDGGLGTGSTLSSNSPQVVNLPNGVKAIAAAAGGMHSLVIGNNGKLYSFGNNHRGQLGDGIDYKVKTPTAISLMPLIPSAIAEKKAQVDLLDNNYPNPFSSSTTLSFTTQQSRHIKLKVYNRIGQEVATLLNEKKEAGTYTILFDASSLPEGLYICKLETENYSQTKKMIVKR